MCILLILKIDGILGCAFKSCPCYSLVISCQNALMWSINLISFQLEIVAILHIVARLRYSNRSAVSAYVLLAASVYSSHSQMPTTAKCNT